MPAIIRACKTVYEKISMLKVRPFKKYCELEDCYTRNERSLMQSVVWGRGSITHSVKYSNLQVPVLL